MSNAARDVAIVGIGALVPDAHDPVTFWEQQVAGHVAIGRIPESYWDPALHADRTRSNPDKSGSDLGAVVRGIPFEPKEFGLPPLIMRDIDPVQCATLITARAALLDAGIREPTDGLRAAVIVGNGLAGTQKRSERLTRTAHFALEETIARLPAFQAYPERHRERFFAELRAAWVDQNSPYSGDSTPGLLGNVIAARVSHLWNFHGPALSVDAACASGLAALDVAVVGLASGRWDFALAGGSDFLMDVATYIGFSAMGALSPDGCFPFDRRANGFVMGEGSAMFALKRLEDARRDGDRIYAVVRGIGASSDGKGRSIVAPNPDGQVRAMREAWLAAGLDPNAVAYVEAHGTATPLGDPTEIDAMRRVFDGAAAGSIAIGSAKANVGHAKYAAGAIGLLRTVLALSDGTIPPHAGFREANPHCRLDGSPFRVPTSPEDWPSDRPTAAVSAFGFGGINYHVVLERHDPPRHSARRRRRTGLPLGLGVFALGAADRTALAAAARDLLARADEPTLALAAELTLRSAPAREPMRAAFFAEDPASLKSALTLLIEVLEKGGSTARLDAAGLSLREGRGFSPDRVALMFPGQGSQYLGMLDELRRRYPIVQATLDEADEVMASILPRKLSTYVSPDVPDGKAFFELTRTEVLQPAMMACNEALRRLLSEIVRPRIVLGHSLGEYSANVAAGTLDFGDALRIVAGRGAVMAQVSFADTGLMLGVGADEARVLELIAGVPGYVAVVNKNCPTQTILGGASAAVRDADKRLKAAGLETMSLPVSHAFHSEIVAPASGPLREGLERLEVRAPETPIVTNITGERYPRGHSAPEWIRDNLARQMASPVEWIRCVEAAYADGARVFIECGPKRALTGFAGDILQKRAHRALQLVHPKTGELVTFGRAIAALVAEGVVAYGIPRVTVDRLPMAKRPPYVQIVEAEPLAPDVASAVAASPNGSPMSFAVLDPVGGDPRFWQFVAQQGPALAGYLASSFRAALGMQGAAPAHTPAPEATAGRALRPQLVPEAPVTGLKGAAEASRGATDTAPSRSPGPDPTSDLAGWIVARVAEKSGYTPDELSLDAHFESELGIDSVRQIEIMLDIREALGLAPDDGFRMADHPTLRSMIGYVSARVGPRSTPVSSAGPGRDIERFVIAQVADKTGYTPDELSLDAQLESELGIDSVRQIEILLAVRAELALPPDDDFRMADHPTLRSLIGYVSSRVGGPPARVEEPPRPF